MKIIEFQHKNATAIYLDYIKRVNRMTKSLTEQDKTDISMELNSYIYEYMEQHKEDDETTALLTILNRLGSPEEMLPPVIADKTLDRATRTFNPKHVLKALYLNISNGISYIIFSLLYLFLVCFAFLAVAKIFFPRNVGVFSKEGSFYVGYFSDSTVAGAQEVLGLWFIPIVLTISVILYMLVTVLMKARRRRNT